MPRSQWIGVIAGVLGLIALIVWSSWGTKTGQLAEAAIVQAQREVAQIHEIHDAELDQNLLRTAEEDLLAANTAFGKGQFAVALDAAQRASQAAQQLLASHRSAEK